MTDLSIIHDECLGFDSSFGLSFIDDNMFCIRCGNFIQICQSKGRALDILSSISGELTGFSAMAGSPLNKVLAYSDDIENPMIHFVDTNGKETGTVCLNGVFGAKSMQFSYDGKWLFALGGLPTFRISAIDFTSKEEVCAKTSNEPCGDKISVCPMHSRTFAVFGDPKIDLPSLPPELSDDPKPNLVLYTLQGCRGRFEFEEIPAQIDSPVEAVAWSPRDELVVATTDGKLMIIDLAGQLKGEPFDLAAVENRPQHATAILCTSKYIIAAGSSGNVYWLKYGEMASTDDLFVLEAGSAVEFLRPFPRGDRLIFGTERNALVWIELDNESHLPADADDAMNCLRESHRGAVNSACCLPHQLITAGDDGTLRFWAVSPCLAQTNKLHFAGERLTALSASKGGSLVAVGSASGVVRLISTADPDDPVLLFRERLHSAPVTAVVIADSFVASASSAGSVVVLRTEPASAFPLVGLLQLRTGVVSLAAPPPLGASPQLLIATSHREVLRVDVPSAAADDFRLLPESLNRALLKVSHRVCALAAEPALREEQQYFFAGCDDRTVKYFCMPITTGDLDIVGVDEVECSSPDDVFAGHAMAVTAVCLSPTQQFVASGCAGGGIVVRELDVATAQVRRVALEATHHSPGRGAISALCFSPDGRRLFSAGRDGSINSYSLRVEPCAILRDDFSVPRGAAFRGSVSRSFLIDHELRSLGEIWLGRRLETTEDDGFREDDGSGAEETPLSAQIRAELAKRRQKAAGEFRGELMVELNAIKDEFMELVTKNEEAPELEKLTREDFTLDVAAAEKLKQLAEVRKALVLYRRAVKRQIRDLCAQRIADRAFAPFEPKLATIHSFKTPIKFDNFPMPRPDAKTLRRRNVVALLRRTEIAAVRLSAKKHHGGGSGHDGGHDIIDSSLNSAIDGARYLFSRSNSVAQFRSEPDEGVVVKDDAQLLYDPFQLLTGNRKVTQATLVQGLILAEMQRFNSLFDDMMGRKSGAVQSLIERNKRIRQLIRLLRLDSADYELFDPPQCPDEDPESFLSVRDDEVVLKGSAAVASAEADDQLQRDGFAERALRQMMGGNVNVNSMEEAPQDDEPVAPEWMTTKKKEEMTEEEQYQVQEFEKKKKLFIEEREKRRKTLSAELTKLYKGTAATVEEFDQQMAAAFIQRIDAEERILYHELEVMHLVRAVAAQRRHQKAALELAEAAERRREEHRMMQPAFKDLAAEAAAAQKAAAAADENLRSIQDQVDKDFKARDNQPQLVKWYRHAVAQRVRPKPSQSPNAFAPFIVGPAEFVSQMDEITDPQRRPQNLPEQRWRNFLDYCEAKMRAAKEQAERGAESAELRHLENKCRARIEAAESDLADLDSARSAECDSLLKTLVDIHVPFTFRAGQVEIPHEAVLVDHGDVVLIDKGVVVGRNKLILDAGQRKIAELENIRRQHSEHKELKWKIAKCNVDLTNLREEIQEYQLFRVTKLDQELIRTRLIKTQGGVDQLDLRGIANRRNDQPKEKPSELEMLKKALNTMTAQHATKMERAAQSLRKLEKKLQKKKQENDKIENEILQMQLNLKERKRIYNIQMKSTEGAQDARKRRLKKVMLVSKFKRAIQVQNAKIAKLREDVTRLRKCVYTSFDNDDTETNEMVEYKA